MQIAVITSMMPSVVQDFVYQHVDEKSAARDIIDRIRSWVGNTVAMSGGPVPMDVGEIDQEWAYEGWDGDEWRNEVVQVVGPDAQCHRCGGWGHMQRECLAPLAGGGRYVIEQSPVGCSGRNGRVERAIQSLEQQVRVMKDALKMKWNVKVPARHSVVPWLIEYSAVLPLWGDGMYLGIRGSSGELVVADPSGV